MGNQVFSLFRFLLPPLFFFFSRPDHITRTKNSMVPTPFQMLLMVMV